MQRDTSKKIVNKTNEVVRIASVMQSVHKLSTPYPQAFHELILFLKTEHLVSDSCQLEAELIDDISRELMRQFVLHFNISAIHFSDRGDTRLLNGENRRFIIELGTLIAKADQSRWGLHRAK